MTPGPDGGARTKRNISIIDKDFQFYEAPETANTCNRLIYQALMGEIRWGGVIYELRPF
jgi:hypothetical protein